MGCTPSKNNTVVQPLPLIVQRIPDPNATVALGQHLLRLQTSLIKTHILIQNYIASDLYTQQK